MDRSRYVAAKVKGKGAERKARIQTYRPEWEDEDELKDWIESSGKGVEYVWCRVCECNLKAKHSDLTHHGQTVKHRRAFENWQQDETRRTSKRQRETCTEDELERAVKDVINKKMGYDKAAKLYKVEKETIRYLVKGRRSGKNSGQGEDMDDMDEPQDSDAPMNLVPEPILGDADNAPASLPQKPEHYHLQHNNHLSTVLSALAQDEVFVDVTLTAQGHSVKAHKSVLSAMSPYFRGVLQDNPCQHPIVIMPHDVKFEELVSIINYIYKGEVTVGAGEVKSLLRAAEILQVTGLVPSEEIAVNQSSEDLAIANTINDFLASTTNSFCTSHAEAPQANNTPKSEPAEATPNPEQTHYPAFIVQGKMVKKAGPPMTSLQLHDPTKAPYEFVNVDMSFIKEGNPNIAERGMAHFTAPQPAHTGHAVIPEHQHPRPPAVYPPVPLVVKEEPSHAVSYPPPGPAPARLTS